MSLAIVAVAAAIASPELSVLIAPQRMDAAAGRGAVDVTLRLPAAERVAGSNLLTLPIVIANTDTVATTLTGLTATDDRGPIPLTTWDEPVAIQYSRYWKVGRATQGPVVVRYRAPVDNTPPRRGSGPPYQLRTEGGGVSGVGNTFLLIPAEPGAHRIVIRWNLRALPRGSSAFSSFGDGEARLPPGPAQRLHSAVYMAGPMQRAPTRVKTRGFSAAWLGETPFDPKPLMGWAERLHGWMSRYWGDTEEPPYRVILRFNPINAGGGAALTNSFLLTYGATARDPEGLKGTLAHEMTHTWTSAGGVGQWYGEGNAVHYQALLPLRAGLITPDAYLKDINDTARRYYTNALNGTPDREIAARFWEDTRIRTLPYDRGAMYFAVLDGKVRRASGGARSLDDLIRVMVKRRQAGDGPGEAAWLELVKAELGEAGLKLHADMLAGALMLPEPDDFGPCFTRTTAPFRRFDLGFEPKSLVGDVKTIRGLDAASAAARAGLRDGDVVTYAVAMDSVQGDPTRTLTLQVTREGKTFPLTYLPRGETVEAWQWARVPGVPDSVCV